MPRVLCIWFPTWAIQRVRNERPKRKRLELALFASQNQRLFVTECDAGAQRRGIYAGQPLAEAKALRPNAVFLAGGFRCGSRGIVSFGDRLSALFPISRCRGVASARVTSLRHIRQFASLGWRAEMCPGGADYWTGRGYQVQLALAGTVGAAWALAHWGQDIVVDHGQEERCLSGLPVEALRLPMETLEHLDSLGLRTIGDVLSLPRETLASRFGVILPRRLDQAMGLLAETFTSERLQEPLTAAREWETPIDDRFVVTLASRQLLRQLLKKADFPGAGLQELEGELRTETQMICLPIRLVEPSRDERHLVRLIELQLEKQEWPDGVVAIRWTVVRLGPLPQIQHSWIASDLEPDTTPALLALVDRLSSRMGDGAVLRVEHVPDAQPEHASRMTPWTTLEAAGSLPFSFPGECSRGRPLRLLGLPPPIEVVCLIPDGRPVRMTWQNHWCDVVRCWGPERIATGWWRSLDVQRDYYRTELENGSHVWIYRDRREGHWFLHGFFE